MKTNEDLYIETEDYTFFDRDRHPIPADEVWVFYQKKGRTTVIGSDPRAVEKIPSPPGLFDLLRKEYIYKLRQKVTYSDRITLFGESGLPLELDLEVSTSLHNPVTYIEYFRAVDSEFKDTPQVLKAPLTAAIENMISIAAQSKGERRVSPLATQDLDLVTLEALLPDRDIGLYIQGYPDFQKLGLQVRATVEAFYTSIAYQYALQQGSYELNDKISELTRWLKANIQLHTRMPEVVYREQIYSAVAANLQTIFPWIKQDLEKVIVQSVANTRRNGTLQTKLLLALLKDLLRQSLNPYIVSLKPSFSSPGTKPPLTSVDSDMNRRSHFAQFRTTSLSANRAGPPDSEPQEPMDPVDLIKELRSASQQENGDVTPAADEAQGRAITQRQEDMPKKLKPAQISRQSQTEATHLEDPSNSTSNLIPTQLEQHQQPEKVSGSQTNAKTLKPAPLNPSPRQKRLKPSPLAPSSPRKRQISRLFRSSKEQPEDINSNQPKLLTPTPLRQTSNQESQTPLPFDQTEIASSTQQPTPTTPVQQTSQQEDKKQESQAKQQDQQARTQRTLASLPTSVLRKGTNSSLSAAAPGEDATATQIFDASLRQQEAAQRIPFAEREKFVERIDRWGGRREGQLMALYEGQRNEGWHVSPPFEQLRENLYIDIGDQCRIWLCVPKQYPQVRPTVEAVYKTSKLPQDHINNYIKKTFGNEKYDLYMIVQAVAAHLHQLTRVEEQLDQGGTQV